MYFEVPPADTAVTALVTCDAGAGCAVVEGEYDRLKRGGWRHGSGATRLRDGGSLRLRHHMRALLSDSSLLDSLVFAFQTTVFGLLLFGAPKCE